MTKQVYDILLTLTVVSVFQIVIKLCLLQWAKYPRSVDQIEDWVNCAASALWVAWAVMVLVKVTQ